MYSIRRWLYKPKRTDTSVLAQFFFADEDLNAIATELDSFDGRKDPERCTALVNQLRQCQDSVLTVIQKVMDEAIPDRRAFHDFRVKFPDDVLQESLAGQLWFGAECLAAGSTIMNREVESISMRPLAKAVTKSLDNLRAILRDQCLRNQNVYTDEIKDALEAFDKLFADFELSYVSAMVPVKTMKEYDCLQDITVLFCETVERALKLDLVTQDMIDDYDPSVMFTIPRLAIVCGLVINPEGPLNPDNDPKNMSDMYRPFQTLLFKIRELLWTLSPEELFQLEKLLCSAEEPGQYRPLAPAFSDTSDPTPSCSSSEQSPTRKNKSDTKKSNGSEDNSNDAEKVNGAIGSAKLPPSDSKSDSKAQDKTDCDSDDLQNQGACSLPQLKDPSSSGSSSYSASPTSDLEAEVPLISRKRADCRKCNGSRSGHMEGASGSVRHKHKSKGEGKGKRRAKVVDRSTQTFQNDSLVNSGNNQTVDLASSSNALPPAANGVNGPIVKSGNDVTDIVDDEFKSVCEEVVNDLILEAVKHTVQLATTGQFERQRSFNFNLPLNTSPRNSVESNQSSEPDTPRTVIFVGESLGRISDINEDDFENKDDVFEDQASARVSELDGLSSENELNINPDHFDNKTHENRLASHKRKNFREGSQSSPLKNKQTKSNRVPSKGDSKTSVEGNRSNKMTTQSSRRESSSSYKEKQLTKKTKSTSTKTSTSNISDLEESIEDGEAPRIQRLQYSDDYSDSSCSTCQSSSTGSDYENAGSEYENIVSCPSSDTSSYNSECHDDEEIALALQAAELASRNENRLRFKSSNDLIHRLFVCISGVSDQLQTNYASDLRNILKAVFTVHSSSEPLVHDLDSAEEVTEDARSEGSSTGALSDRYVERSDGEGSLESNSEEEEEETEITPRENAFMSGHRSINTRERVFQEAPAWVPDEQAPHCYACKVPFTFVRRRHHCRNCGKIFCSRCSSNSVPLPHYGHVKPVRVCNRCFMFQVTPFTVD